MNRIRLKGDYLLHCPCCGKRWEISCNMPLESLGEYYSVWGIEPNIEFNTKCHTCQGVCLHQKIYGVSELSDLSYGNERITK